MNRKKEKPFDAVKFMRERRDELSKQYNADPENFKRELINIRKKYQRVLRTNQKSKDN